MSSTFSMCLPGMTINPMKRCWSTLVRWWVCTIAELLGSCEDDVAVSVDTFEPAFEGAGVGYCDAETLIKPFIYDDCALFVAQGIRIVRGHSQW
jgi:hypothetical protein